MHPFISEFKERGFFYQCTDEHALSESLKKKKNPSAYIGFDCTAPALHVGSLLQIMILRMLQKHGVRPIALMGGATTKIGDPTGKDTSRMMLSDDEIKSNTEGIKSCIEKFVSFEGPNAAILLDNSDWLDKLKYTELLREVGMHFSINKMLTFDSVKLRLEREQSLSFLEFNYMILQGYDFMYLSKFHNCILQCGGSDQWGNIINGVELTRKMLAKEVFGLTTPLISTASGAKMGKSEKGAIWLDGKMLSPYDYYQFWRNSDDNDVFKFMKIFTDILVSEINKYQNDTTTNINEYKKILAFEATKLCHGESAAEEAMKTAVAVFERGEMENIAIFELNKDLIVDGIFAYELFRLSGMADSNGSAKRLIRGSGASVNKEKIIDETIKLYKKDFKKNGCLILSSGKKQHIKIVLN